jgi:hypothetical protein
MSSFFRPFATAPICSGVAVLALVLSLTGVARADQPRDWMISAPLNGTFANVDIVLPGAQLGLEHRVPIYGQANQLTLRGNALYTLPFFEPQADVELRIVVLTLGGSVGFHDDLQHMDFGPNESIDRGARRMRFVNGWYDQASWAYGEGRATLSLPLSDWALFNAINYLRVDGAMPNRTYDYRNGIVRDGGTLFKSDIMLFFKDRSFGGVGPMMQVLNFSLGTHRFTQLNYGLQFVMRPGLVRKDDILFFQLLFNPGSTLGTYDNEKSYGNHLLFSPINFTLAYRVVLPVWKPETP